jgi:UDP-glucuronate 4-epimerase
LRILVTGAAGFIGYHTCEALLERGYQVIGLDNLNDYYDPRLKHARLDRLTGRNGFAFVKADLADRAAMDDVFQRERPQRVINLAAQAGVRYASENPHAYIGSNVTGFLHVLEGCRHYGVEHLVFASTSSVYGANTTMPFHESADVAHPLNIYAATKKSNELMAHAYAHLYGIPVTGLRFFTVYGPWGRPDMSLFSFTQSILAGKPIEVFNNGEHARDFTYVDDIVEGIVRLVETVATPDPRWDSSAPRPDRSTAPYRIYNIGNSRPVKLMDYIAAIERAVGRTAEKHFLPLQPGDVPRTAADVSELEQTIGFRPATPIEVGIGRFVAWYREYHKREGYPRSSAATL